MAEIIHIPHRHELPSPDGYPIRTVARCDCGTYLRLEWCHFAAGRPFWVPYEPSRRELRAWKKENQP